MISQADQEIIATVFSKTPEELSGALTAENEVSLGLRLNGKVFTQEEIDQLKKTHTDAGVEIGTKKMASALKIDLDAGEKDPVKLAEKLRSSVISQLEEKYKNPEPGEQLAKSIEKQKEWETKYNTLLQTHEKETEKIQEWEKKYNSVIVENKNKTLNEKIISSFPEKMRMDRSDALLIFRNNFEHDEDDEGNIIFKRGGKIVQDPVGNPEKLENIVKGFVEEKKWIKTGGMGGGDDPQPGLPKGMSADQAVAYLQEKGIEPMSQKGSEMFTKLVSK
jgi:hypothetical protein